MNVSIVVRIFISREKGAATINQWPERRKGYATTPVDFGSLRLQTGHELPPPSVIYFYENKQFDVVV